jgi:hypothetical protein
MDLQRLFAATVIAVSIQGLSAWGAPRDAVKAESRLLEASVRPTIARLSDGLAVEFRQAREVFHFSQCDGHKIAIVLARLEGFSGGNNHAQFVLVFRREGADDQRGSAKFRLLTSTQVGGRGHRLLYRASVVEDVGISLVIRFAALVNGPDDGPNFPTQQRNVYFRLTLDPVSGGGKSFLEIEKELPQPKTRPSVSSQVYSG